ncbi:hypothetical protein [Chromobacterium haemolyticum]|nr:hypothetical protein [Chromobacterium haemolyticum]
MNDLYFMIEGGAVLELIKAHIAKRKLVQAAVQEMAKELGVEGGVTNRLEGNLLGVIFPGDRHPDFKAPDRNGVCYPKKNSEWAKRLAAAPRYQPASIVISDALGVPTDLHYTSQNCYGSTGIGHPFQECGFLYLSESGPFAMWIPDVPGEVALMEAEGKTVKDPAKSFVPEFDGCRRIDREEWDFVVAQYQLQKKRKQAEGEKA